MSRRSRILTLVATLPLIALAAPASADHHCEREPELHKLKIRVVDDKPVEVLKGGNNAEVLHVCDGDTVEWKLQAEARAFYIDFPDGTPYSGDPYMPERNGKIEIQIVSQEGENDFKYDIGLVDGERWDPRIVVDD